MFLARTDEQRRFEGALAEIENPRVDAAGSQVFLLHGLGGMGKTELCRRFAKIAQGELQGAPIDPGRFLVAMVNWQDERRNRGLRADPAGLPPSAVLAAIHETLSLSLQDTGEKQLSKQAAKAFDPYLETLAELRDPLGKIHSAGGSRPAAEASPLGDLLTQILEQGGASAGTPALGAAAGGLARAIHEKSRSESSAFINPERVDELLTRQLAQGLRDLSEQRPIVVILDHYEIVASCGSWVRKAMQWSGPGVLWVVAARLEPEEEAGSRGDLAAFRREISEHSLRVIPMSTFGRETIREELEQRGVKGVDETLLEAIETLTRGVPLAVSLVAGMLAQGEDLQEIGQAVTEKGDTTMLVRELAERYLIHTFEDPDLAKDAPLLLGLALLYADRGDPDVLRAIWGEGREVESTLAELSERHDFVLSGSRRLHQEVRDTFRRYLLDGVRRAERRSSNHDAAEVALARANQIAASRCEENLRKEEWRLDVAAMVWHRFWQGNEFGLQALCEVFPAAVLLHRTFAHDLVEIASFFKDTFNEEQRTLVRGLASLLSFGGFLDGWTARRQNTLHRDVDLDPYEEEREAVLEQLRLRAGSSRLEGLTDLGPSLVSLLTAKTLSRANPSVALANLTAASADLPADKGELASELAQTASDLAGRLREPDSEGKGTIPSAEAMRAGELWSAYTSFPARVRLWFGRAHRDRGEIDLAMAAFDELDEMLTGEEDEDSRSNLASALFGKAWVYSKREQYEDELGCYERIIEVSGDARDLRQHIAHAMYFRVGAYSNLGRSDDAAEERGRVFERFKDDTNSDLRSLAMKTAYRHAFLLSRVQPEAALDLLDEVIERSEADKKVQIHMAGAHLWKTSLLLLLRRWEEVGPVADQLIQRYQDPDLTFLRTRLQALRNKALALSVGGNTEALAVYDELLEQTADTDDPECRRLAMSAISDKTRLSMRLGRETSVEEARKQIETLLEAGPNLSEAFSVYALFLMEVGEDEKRIEDTFEALVEIGADANTLANYARFRFEQGDLEQGRDLAGRALDFPRSEPEMQLEVHYYLALLGTAEQQSASLVEVRKLLERGIRSPDWNLRGVLDQATREKHPARDWFEKLAAVVNDEAPLDVLREWSAWS